MPLPTCVIAEQAFGDIPPPQSIFRMGNSMIGHNVNQRALRREQSAGLDCQSPLIIDRVFTVALGATLALCAVALASQGFSR